MTISSYVQTRANQNHGSVYRTATHHSRYCWHKSACKPRSRPSQTRHHYWRPEVKSPVNKPQISSADIKCTKWKEHVSLPTATPWFQDDIHWWHGSWGQQGAHLGPTGPRCAPCWPHELCYPGRYIFANGYSGWPCARVKYPLDV